MPKQKKSRFNKLNKLKLPKSRSSRVRLGLFVAAFALIGVYLVFASFAAYISSTAEGVQYSNVNAFRSNHGIGGLSYNGCLTNMARSWAQQLAAQNGESHNPNLQAQMNNCFGSVLRTGGENVGAAYWNSTKGSWPCNDTDNNCSYAVFQLFTNSAEHKDNMLSTGFTDIGIGAYRDDRGVLWVVQDFAGCSGGCPGRTSPPSISTTYSPPPPPPASTPQYKAISLAPCVGGYTMDVSGALHPFNGFGGASGAAVWPGQNVARMVAVDPRCNGQGYTLDLYGGIHPFNGAPGVQGTGYWPGKDIARDLKFYNWNTHQGYVLDKIGGIHSINGAPTAHGTGYWPSGGDIARKFAINGAGTGGYVMDLQAGIHPFGIGSNPIPQGTYGGPYWNADVARGIVLDPNGHDGYILDYCGAIHPFAVNGYSMPPKITHVTWYDCSADLARDIVVTVWNKNNSGQPGGYVLDKKGGVHLFGP